MEKVSLKIAMELGTFLSVSYSSVWSQFWGGIGPTEENVRGPFEAGNFNGRKRFKALGAAMPIHLMPRFCSDFAQILSSEGREGEEEGLYIEEVRSVCSGQEKGNCSEVEDRVRGGGHQTKRITRIIAPYESLCGFAGFTRSFSRFSKGNAGNLGDVIGCCEGKMLVPL